MGTREMRVPVPAAVEFLSRFALAAHRRYGPKPARTAARDSSRRAESPDAAALIRSLCELGIRRGDVLMVHSDSAAVEALGWTPSDLIDCLLEYLGPQGTLAMPTHPKLLRTDGREVYDVRRSSSTVGVLTELFRRRQGAMRSAFPLSAAAAMGVAAGELISEHDRSWAPHDEHSPYAKLAAVEGKALCIGCPLDRMTILHVAEDVMREELPIPGFYQSREIVVQGDGDPRTVRVDERAPWLWWYLNLGRWTYEMYRRSLAKDFRLSDVTLRAADARATVDWMKAEIRAGRSIYPLSWANRWLRLKGRQPESAA